MQIPWLKLASLVAMLILYTLIFIRYESFWLGQLFLCHFTGFNEDD